MTIITMSACLIIFDLKQISSALKTAWYVDVAQIQMSCTKRMLGQGHSAPGRLIPTDLWEAAKYWG